MPLPQVGRGGEPAETQYAADGLFRSPDNFCRMTEHVLINYAAEVDPLSRRELRAAGLKT